MKQRLLFVDDEASIRMTLPAILIQEGFDVTVAATVPEALEAMQKSSFDILLSDLNIGQPGVGFTVVSAMRRVQPEAATFILTGYPDFESALIAIRNQVDDYLTKPVDIKKMVETLKEKASGARLPHRAVLRKRISAIIRDNRDDIIERWVTKSIANPELSPISLSNNQRTDHISDLLVEIADRIERHPDTTSEDIRRVAVRHGRTRHAQGYTVPMLLVESSILEKTIAEVLEEHLLAIEISTLIRDMNQMSEAINCAVELSIRAFLEAMPEPKTR